ncbi:MAG: HEAT repeat domain-containing protein, partial [Desulfobacterales bacterium]|nr:HEAT repeat domain-containing protein [Desulfobacterales bacterium]
WLKGTWKKIKIIQEFERRKSVEGLEFCLHWATAHAYRRGLRYTTEDAIKIVNALGRIKNPKAIPVLSNATPKITRKEFKLAVLKAYKEIDSPEAVFPIIRFLKDLDPDIRFQALDSLGQIKATESMEAVFPMLLDDDANIRWKAVHTLGEIGDPRAAGRIGFLLADPDESVQGLAENVLKKLGTSEAKIADWKQKAGQLSIDEVYRTKLAYQKAEIEKEELVKKLKSEKDLKKQLEESLKNQETAFGKQKNIVESLYEKERQLKSKQVQLDITRQQSEEYQNELQRLNLKVQSLNAELKQAKTQAATENVKEELDKTLEAKSKLEQETKNSREKESLLLEEIASLNALAEKTRMEAEDAKKEVVALRNREKQLVAQVDELKQRLDRSMAPVLVVSKPENGTKIESPTTLLHFIAVDDKGIREINVLLNENPVKINDSRGIKIAEVDSNKISKKIDLT